MKSRKITVQNGEDNIRQYRVIIYRDEDDVYIAECPALDGCMTDGATFEEAYENIKDAVACYVSALKELGKPIPEEREIFSSVVSVAL
jgi:predicted RNase H-like HicB family nuclease